MTKLIAFDLVGTLIRGEAFRDARNSVRFNLDDAWDEATDRADFANRFDYQAVFQAYLDQASASVLCHQFRDYLVKRVTDYLYPEVCQVVQTLDSQGITLGFVTDGSNDVEAEMIRCILQHCGIEPGKCVIITGQDVGAEKKTGRPFMKLVERAKALGIEPKDIVVVGDNPEADVGGAASAGLRAVMLRRLPLVHSPANDEINSLADLLNAAGLV